MKMAARGRFEKKRSKSAGSGSNAMVAGCNLTLAPSRSATNDFDYSALRSWIEAWHRVDHFFLVCIVNVVYHNSSFRLACIMLLSSTTINTLVDGWLVLDRERYRFCELECARDRRLSHGSKDIAS
jgi:hypothetical protein